MDTPDAAPNNLPEDDSDGELEIELQPPTAPAQPPGEDTDALPPAPAQEDVLVIDTEDLADLDDQPFPAAEAGYFPPVDTSPMGMWAAKKKVKPGLLSGGLVGSMMLQMIIAGAVGAFLAWLMVEPGLRYSELHRGFESPGLGAMLANVTFFGAALGGMIGMALGAVEGLVVSAWGRAATGAALGLLIGGVGGALGGLAGQAIFSMLLSGVGHSPGAGTMFRVVLARALGWALVGACVGLGPGVMMMVPRKILNGLIGGAAGGFLGGLLFDPLGAVLMASGSFVGTPSRFVGILVMGMATGAGIGLVEEIRKEAWLLIVGGPLTGKQFILYKPVTWIGSAPGMDLPLLKDRTLAPKHCSLEQVGGGHVLRDLSGGRTAVNGMPPTDRRLVAGDVLQLGSTMLQYQTRPFASGPLS
ncbi:FHA domain-containing protein [bacterium]|nr:FHA domain-containing protein [bacterium]